MSESVVVTLEREILTLTLNRPAKRNAIDLAVMDALARGLARAELEQGIRVVVLRGAGTDFCAGIDLEELLASAQHPLSENEKHALALGELFLALRRLPKPTVALLHGRALASGAGLAMACDIVLATETSQIGYPEIERGFVASMIMPMLRRAVPEKRAFELLATGRLVSAREALGLGMISRVFADAEFEREASALLTTLSNRSATAFSLTKQLFAELDGMSFAEGIFLGARVNALARATPDFQRAIREFLGS